VDFLDGFFSVISDRLPFFKERDNYSILG